MHAYRTPRSFTWNVVTTLAALTCLLGWVPAANAVAIGSALQVEPNMNHGCELRPGVSDAGGNFSPIPIVTDGCTMFQGPPFGVLGSTLTGFVPADGLVRTVSVRSGANPAPLRISILRVISTPLLPNGTVNGANSRCCFGVSESATFQPTPNAVTTVTVNLPVQNNVDAANNIAVSDIVGISAQAGTGSLPVRVNGVPNTAQSTQPGVPSIAQFHPAIAPQQVRTDQTGFPSAELLLQFDWCSGAARNACATTKPETPSPPVAASPSANTTSATPPVRGTRAHVPVRCVSTVRCVGRVRLMSRTRPARVLGTTRINVAAQSTRSVQVPLTAVGRVAIAARTGRVAATVRIELDGVAAIARGVTLRRAGLASIVRRVLATNARSATVTMRCAAGHPCRGRVRLVTRDRAQRLIGLGPVVRLAPRTSRATTIALSTLGRRLMRDRTSLAATARIELTDGQRQNVGVTLRANRS